MLSVDNAMNRYAGVANTGGPRPVERPNATTAVPGTSPSRASDNAMRPSTVVSISAQGREQLSRATAAESVQAVDQSKVATNETNALQARAAEQTAEAPRGAAPADASVSGRADPRADTLARDAGPASGDLNAAQQKDGVRAN